MEQRAHEPRQGSIKQHSMLWKRQTAQRGWRIVGMREHSEIKQEDSTEATMNGSVSQSKKFRLQPVRSGDFKWRIFFL